MVPTAAAGADSTWRTERADHVPLFVFKNLTEPSEEDPTPRPLPIDSRTRAILGSDTVEYDRYVVASLSEAEGRMLLPLLRDAGYMASVDADRSIHAFAHRFDPVIAEERLGAWRTLDIEPVVLPGLAWVQFAYPIRREWFDSLRECWAETLWAAPSRAVLVAVPMISDMISCPVVEEFGAIVEPVLSIDRTDPSVLTWPGEIEVELVPGATLDSLFAVLPTLGNVEVETIEPGARRVTVLLSGEIDTQALVREPLILRISPRGEAVFSDETQALILARQWDPVSGEPLGPFPTANPLDYDYTYLDWLTARQLTGPANQQTIAFFDTGVDIGEPTNLFHPDIRNRVVGAYNITVNPPVAGFAQPDPLAQQDDRGGHGTHVIGTAIGAGGNAGRDNVDYRARGQGIAPEAKALSIKRGRHVVESGPGAGNPDCTFGKGLSDNFLDEGQDWAVSFPTPASIANHSWNFASSSYTFSDDFDLYVRDSSSSSSTTDPMTIVFSAGNWRPECVDCGTQCAVLQCQTDDDSPAVRDPATAKNVITVGSVDSYFYDPNNTATCPGFLNTPDPVDDAFVVSEFSTRAPAFGPGRAGVHQVRVKPDVMAPGWRVSGPIRPNQPCTPFLCGDDSLPTGNFSFARGTSFAAPAVSGAAALKSKQFRDGLPNGWPNANGLVPQPTLLKAALVATAQSLGPLDLATGLINCTDGDCRPSPTSGWGLVDLERLTDRETPVYFHNEANSIDFVGDGWTSAWLRAGDYSEEILVALVWNDIPTSTALARDLHLRMEVTTWDFMVGNNFAENIGTADSGYSVAFNWIDNSVHDHVNTVEAIFLLPNFLVPGSKFRLHVTSDAHPGHPIFTEQRFSVYVWNAHCDKKGFLCF